MHAAPSLPELQRQFAAALLHGEAAPLAEWVLGRGLGPEARVQVYRNMVFANHATALRAAYPAVLKLVGEDFFEAAAARYLRDYPTSSGNLQDYGARFSEFLAHLPEAVQLGYLPDVARLEWARQESYLAADAESIAVTGLAAIPDAERLHVHLHPSVKLVTSVHPIWDIWMFCQETAPQHLNLSGGAQTALVWRDAHQIAMQPVTGGCYSLLSALLTREPLAIAYEHAVAAEADFDLSTCLRWLFTTALVTGLEHS